jgi:hypothetical protein
MFSRKQWADVPLSEWDILADPHLRRYVVQAPRVTTQK